MFLDFVTSDNANFIDIKHTVFKTESLLTSTSTLLPLSVPSIPQQAMFLIMQTNASFPKLRHLLRHCSLVQPYTYGANKDKCWSPSHISNKITGIFGI